MLALELMFNTFPPIAFKDRAPRWAAKVPRYSRIFGYSSFAHLFVCSEDQTLVAVVVTEHPEFIELTFESLAAFEQQFLGNSDVRREFFKEQDHAALCARLGPLGNEECFYPVPFRSIGGSGDLSTYEKGNVWVHLDLYGQTVGL